MICHIVALVVGFVIDLIVGDPYKMPHPIRLIGSFIAWLDRCFLGDDIAERNKTKERIMGALLCIIVVLSTGIATAGILVGAYFLNIYVGIVVEAILTAYILATKSLRVESMKVYSALKIQDIEKARYAVSMIVGRDTDCLDEEGITKAAVETVAENTSDGVIAPLLYTAIGGPILGLIYKSINTMDSMIGYHNDRYEDFGMVAARLDDAVNFLPARISAILMIVASFLMGPKYNTANAIEIFKRDRFNHKSPNSAQTESVCAGALGLKLAGDAYYFGKLNHKQTIGDELKAIEAIDIVRVNNLMYVTALLGLLLCILGCVCFI